MSSPQKWTKNSNANFRSKEPPSPPPRSHSKQAEQREHQDRIPRSPTLTKDLPPLPHEALHKSKPPAPKCESPTPSDSSDEGPTLSRDSTTFPLSHLVGFVEEEYLPPSPQEDFFSLGSFMAAPTPTNNPATAGAPTTTTEEGLPLPAPRTVEGLLALNASTPRLNDQEAEWISAWRLSRGYSCTLFGGALDERSSYWKGWDELYAELLSRGGSPLPFGGETLRVAWRTWVVAQMPKEQKRVVERQAEKKRKEEERMRLEGQGNRFAEETKRVLARGKWKRELSAARQRMGGEEKRYGGLARGVQKMEALEEDEEEEEEEVGEMLAAMRASLQDIVDESQDAAK